MDLQAEKIELIKLIADLDSEKIIRKIKEMLAPSKPNKQVDFNPSVSLTREGMLLSESSLNETWKNENDEEWAQYLKD